MGRKSIQGSRLENMTDLEHMLLPFLDFSHKCIILMLHLQQIVFLLGEQPNGLDQVCDLDSVHY